MPLETPAPTNFNALNTAWPTNGDGATVGNEHIQQLKNVLRQVFPDNGAAGQFDTDVVLAPSGTTPGAGVGTKNAYVNGLDASGAINARGAIENNEQVSIASAGIDGATGGVLNSANGISSISRTAVGQYEVTLAADRAFNDWRDIIVSGSANLGVGWLVVNGVGISGTNNKLRVVSYNPTNYTFVDSTNLFFVAFDCGRD